MRVLVVSVVHTPLDARIHHRQIRALTTRDVEVTQVAPWRETGTAPGDGVDGVRRIDVPRAVGRRRLRALRAARRLIARFGPSHDLILLHDPELLLAVAGRLRRLPPVVLDVHEDLAAALVDRAWVPAPLRLAAAFAVRRVERFAERHLAALLLAEEGYRERFDADHLLVPNLPWLPAEPPTAVDTGRVVHVGRLSVGRGALELVAVADELARAGGPMLDLIGPADDDVSVVLQAAHDRGVLTWHGFLANDAAMDLLQGAVAGLALLHDLPNYRVSLPTKIGEYLANGVPPIVTPLPEAVRLVEESGCGVVVPFGDVPATVDAVLGLAADLPRRQRLGALGRSYVADGHSWDAVAPRFVAHLRALARGSSAEEMASGSPVSPSANAGNRAAPRRRSPPGRRRHRARR
jgi:glycosyltransferase involved in cell wall biosynthesis